MCVILLCGGKEAKSSVDLFNLALIIALNLKINVFSIFKFYKENNSMKYGDS